MFTRVLFLFISLQSFSQQMSPDSLKQKFDYDSTYGLLDFQREKYKRLIGSDFIKINSKDINGEALDPARSKRLVFYNFWHTRCAPCIAESDMLNQLKAQFSEEVDFIGITFETKESILDFNKKHPFNFRQFSVPEKSITDLFLYQGYPASFLVLDGKIIEMSTGGPADLSSNISYVSLFNTYSVFRSAIEKKLREIKK